MELTELSGNHATAVDSDNCWHNGGCQHNTDYAGELVSQDFVPGASAMIFEQASVRRARLGFSRRTVLFAAVITLPGGHIWE